nr:hypothetical protein [Tanacetum cinerariifolium]
MVEEVTFLKKDFKQKENKYLEDFLDMKSLKEKVEDRLLKQDQSLQTVYMLCRPKLYYNELNKVAIGYKNPLCLTRAKKFQPALYNGHEIIKDNHVPAIVHNTKDTLEIAEITRKKMNDKIKDPKCALTKEIKEMKDVFEELEVEVAQNVVDRKHDAIERKNLLIACCLELEVELANLRDKSHHDNQEELINHFSKLEHYKELYDFIKITRAKHIEQVTALTTENVNLKAQILEKVNNVGKDQVKPKVLARGKHTIDVEPLVPRLRNNRDAHLNYLRHLKESVETIRDIVAKAKVKTNVLVPPSTGVKHCTNASGSQPKRNTKKNRISPAKGVNKLPVEEQSRTNKSLLKTSNRVDSSSHIKRTEHMAWQTDYCIMKEGMPILRRQKSIPGMNSSEREMER